MAALGSSKIHELIARLFCRPAERTIFDMRKPDYPAVRVLVEADVPTADSVDSAWLERVELNSPERVTEILERCGCLRLADNMKIMFVDARCGLIRTELIATPAGVGADEIVSEILRTAARCDARGIILASQPQSGLLARWSRWREIHDKLRRKGEAIEVFLLDHFVLTARGWKRMGTARKAKRT